MTKYLHAKYRARLRMMFALTTIMSPALAIAANPQSVDVPGCESAETSKLVEESLPSPSGELIEFPDDHEHASSPESSGHAPSAASDLYRQNVELILNDPIRANRALHRLGSRALVSLSDLCVQLDRAFGAPAADTKGLVDPEHLKTPAARLLMRLVANAELNTRIRRDKALWSAISRDPRLQTEFSTSPDYERRLRQGATLRFLYSEPSGVGEGYTIGEHTSRVLSIFFDQKKHHALDKLRLPNGIRHTDRIMALTLAFHDIGKSLAARSGNKDYELRYSVPMIKLLMKHLGFNQGEVDLAGALVNTHQDIGTVLKAAYRQNPDLAPLIKGIRDHIVENAKAAKIPPADLFKLMEVVYVADAGSYPGLIKSVFQADDAGRLQIRDQETYRELQRQVSQ